MPPKRGKADGSPAKEPMQSSTKRTRRDLSQPSQSASDTGVDLPSHDNVDEYPFLIVDYNETTPFPSPQSGDEHNSGECELKAPPSTPSASLARRREGGYVSGGLPPMPPPSEWMNSDGSSAALLQRATIDAHRFYSVFPLWKKQGKALGRAFPIPVVLRSNETADDYEAELWRRVTLHEDATKQRSQRISFAMKRAHEIMGNKRPPINSRHASSASPSGPSRKKTAGAASHKQPPAQALQRAKRPQAPMSQSSLGNPSTGQGFGAFASQTGGPTAFQQGSAYSLPCPPAQVAPDRSGDYAHLLAAAYPAAVQSQAKSAALKRQVTDLESQVSRLTSYLRDVRARDRQGYDRLKTRLDILERLVMRDPRQARSPPRSSSPLSPRSYTGASRLPRRLIGRDARLTVDVTIGLARPMWICDLFWINIPLQTTHVKYGVSLHIRWESEPII
ncbi:unnamed protein product [Peronospora farinosa]|uniref:Uncharacterized protein n=1 Tax=Peronospora farinosa TaxID=134698 RepID=A0AAV0T4Z0_9STRA|nr:unnamed protein product [Peronospora farinosa]